MVHPTLGVFVHLKVWECLVYMCVCVWGGGGGVTMCAVCVSTCHYLCLLVENYHHNHELEMEPELSLAMM